MRAPKRLAVIAMATLITACGGGSPTGPSQPTCTPVTTSLLSLRPGELFRVRFRVPSGLSRDIVILTYLGLPSSGFASSTIVQRLYDGATLLGTEDRAEQDTTAFWKSPESSFGTPGDTTYAMSAAAISVNVDSIVNGTIDGRVELAVTSGQVSISSAAQAEVVLIGPARTFPDTRVPIVAREWCH